MATNPPSVPSLDVEACVRLLEKLADAATNVTAEGEDDYTADASLLRALASALPGMGKDSERMAKLVALLGDKEDRGVVTLGWENGSCCVWAGDDGDFQESVGFGDDLAAALDDVELEDDDNADAARAAQPEETSATRCVICQKDGDYDEMVATYDGEPAHRSCRATVEPWSTATDGFCSTCGNPKHWQSLSPRCVGFHTPRAWVRLA